MREKTYLMMQRDAVKNTTCRFKNLVAVFEWLQVHLQCEVIIRENFKPMRENCICSKFRKGTLSARMHRQSWKSEENMDRCWSPRPIIKNWRREATISSRVQRDNSTLIAVVSGTSEHYEIQLQNLRRVLRSTGMNKPHRPTLKSWTLLQNSSAYILKER